MRRRVLRYRPGAVALALLLMTACGESLRSAPTPDPTPATDHANAGTASPTALVVVNEPPELDPGGTLVFAGGQACTSGDEVLIWGGVIASVYPPFCSGVPVDGLDLASLPGLETFTPSEPNGTHAIAWAYVTLLAIWDGERLQVEQANPPQPSGVGRYGPIAWCADGLCTPREPLQSTTCPGAPTVAEDATEEPGEEIRQPIAAYQDARPDIAAGSWLDHGRMWVAFTDDPDAHVDALCAIDPTVEILQLPHSLRVLRDIQARAIGYADAEEASEATEPSGEPVAELMSAEVDVTENRARVTVQFADRTTVDTLQRQHGADRIAVESWMIPVTAAK